MQLKYKRAKIFMLLFVFLMVMYFTSDFHLIDIEKTAIVIAIGIDKKDDQFEVTTQIAIPQASDQQSTNSDAVLSAKGATVYEAIENISLDTGWYPKLTFCNVILFGPEVISEDFMPIVDYLLTSKKFQSSAIIATCEESAKDTLSASTPLDYISSFALQKILFRSTDRANAVLVNDIREFEVNTHSLSSFAFMPLIKTKSTDDKSKGDQSSSFTQPHADVYNSCVSDEAKNNKAQPYRGENGKSGAGSGGDSQGGSQQKQTADFDAQNTIFFSGGKIAGMFDPMQTLVYNLITKSAFQSFIDVDYESGGKTVSSFVSITDNKCSIELAFENGLPVLNIDLTVTCESEEISSDLSVEDTSNLFTLSEKAKSAVEEKLKEQINSLFLLYKQSGCDYFKTLERLHRYHKDKFASFKDSLKDLLVLNVKTKCVNLK